MGKQKERDAFLGLGAIRQRMQAILERCRETQTLDIHAIYQEMEPLFQQYGYREHAEGEPVKILLMHDGGAGDFISAAPAIHAVRKQFPGAYITLVVYPRSRDLAATCPYVDQVVVNPRQHDWKNPLEILQWNLRFAEKLLPMHYDICFSLAWYGCTVLLSYLCGAMHRIGAPQGFQYVDPLKAEFVDELLTGQPPKEAVRGRHTMFFYLAPVENALGREARDPHPEVWLLAGERECWQAELQAKAPEAAWISVSLGGTNGRRRWPVASYQALLSDILAEESARDVRFLLIGGPEDRKESGLLVAALPPGKAWNLAGKLSYRASVAALSCCTLYIGNDTGLMHAAGAAGLPVLSPNCYAADLPMNEKANPLHQYPYGVPAVMVLPAHARPECKSRNVSMGCAASGRPHCILDIRSSQMLAGYHVLKEQIRLQKTELLFLFETEDAVHRGHQLVILPRAEIHPDAVQATAGPTK